MKKININKEEIEIERLSNLISEFNFSQFMTKYKLIDYIKLEDEPIITELLENVVKKSPQIEDLKPIVFTDYIAFENIKNGKIERYYDLDISYRIIIDRYIYPIFVEEVKKMRKKLRLN